MSARATETALMPRKLAEYMRPSTITPQDARRWVVRELGEWQADAEVVDDAALITSELVTNACLYGPSDGVVTVSIRGLSGGRFEIAVHDQGRIPFDRWAPAVGDEHGNGLTLVRAVSASFDVTVHRVGGKTVTSVLGPAGIGLAA